MRYASYFRWNRKTSSAQPRRNCAGISSFLASLAGVWLVCAPALGEPRGVVSNAVAVADFELEDAHPGARDWAFGLADVLAVELQQRGVVLFERQQIRVVLGERRITASGLSQLRSNPSQEIPDLRYLVTGDIRPATQRQFHVRASLVEAQSGRNAASFAREGRYPEEVPGALASLADEIAGRLKSEGVAPRLELAASYRPAHTPEVSLLFYKGIAYCLAGQPEQGVTWFIDTSKADPHFLPARVWTMRAFEMLGLEDFAAVARENVRQAPNGQGVLDRLDKSRFLDQKLVSVAVIADPRLEAAGWKVQAELRTALGRYTNLFVADAANIRSLAAEMDLQLTEKGGRDLELASVLWSTVDALVLLRPAEKSEGGSFSVELEDALTGSPLFRGQTPRDGSKLADLSRDLAAQISTRRKAMPPEHGRETAGNSHAVRPIPVVNTDRDECAGLLKYLSENPSDRPAWMRLALFFPWIGGSFQGKISDRVVAATDLKEPEAANWLSVALWHRRQYENPPSLAVEAATLLEHFPESPEAQYVRSALALEFIDHYKYAQAAPILLKLAKELPVLTKRVKIGPDYWANFYFFTGAVLHEMGDDEQARQFLARADEVLREHPDLSIFDGNTFALGVWVNHFPVNHPLFGPERDLRQAVAEWKARIASVRSARGKEMTLEQLEMMLTGVRQMSDPEAKPKHVEFVQRLIEQMQHNPALYQGRITESIFKGPYRKVDVWGQGPTYGYFSLPGKLVMEATFLLGQMATGSPQEIAEARRLAEALAENLEAHIAAVCYEAVGEFEKALRKVEEAVRHPAPFPQLPNSITGLHPTREQSATGELRRQKIRLLQGLGKPAEAAAYAKAQAEIRRPDADAQLAATMDAAKAFIAIDRPDEAGRLFAEFIRRQETAGTMTIQSATARIWWADQEIARGNLFEASEILRAVARQSEGKGWGVYLRSGYAGAYEAAVSRLGQLRSRPLAPRSTDNN